MLFNSPTFLFYFLPVVLITYLVIGKRIRNTFLLVASLFFYLWGATSSTPIILLSIGANFFLGKWVDLYRDNSTIVRRIVNIALAFNISLLAFFKISSAYAPELINILHFTFPNLPLQPMERMDFLPLGISFYSFAAIAYILDIQKGRSNSEPRLDRFALYIMLFPKVVAGPIERYREITTQLVDRVIETRKLSDGARRFIIGFGKKVLIADTLAPIADRVFALGLLHLTTSMAWLGILCYTIQIYFDFSGYTDMAIGLGRMLGFEFVENFNYPYISKSITEFWQRWHISLSRWFRDYVFFPLERRNHLKRRASEKISDGVDLAQCGNILFVFLLTGLWHGMTPQFAIWGLLHGSAISLEVNFYGRWLKSTGRLFQHTYAMTVIMTGWVFFRAQNLHHAFGYLKALVGFSQGSGLLPFASMPIMDTHTWLALVLGIMLSAPIFPNITSRFGTLIGKLSPEPTLHGLTMVTRDALLLGLFLVSIMVMAGSTYHPYIYFRF
jgi:alginate O-acetyltransferase complex protein AlgI